MKYDFTHGEEARYIVSVYGEKVQDQMYYHSYRRAKGLFDLLKKEPHEKGTVISIYDLRTDTRKDFAKV